MQQDLTFCPQFFQIVELALFRREDVQDKKIKIDGDPPITGDAFDFSFYIELFMHGIIGCFQDATQHTVAGSATKHKIIRKMRDPAQVHQHDILSFLRLQGVHELAGDG